MSRSSIGFAFGGAVFFEIISISSNHSFSSTQIPTHLEALALGSIAGLLFGALREQLTHSRRLIADADALTFKLKLQQDALQLPLRCPRHAQVITLLISQSLEQYRLIPNVSVLEYLSTLRKAIEHSNRYQGVQRKPIRWFLDGPRETYLETLRDSHIMHKTRIFVLDDEDLPTMKEDMTSSAIHRYWELTGEGTETYWISLTELLGNFPGMHAPKDCAVYDGGLFIEYDSEQHLLTFDALADGTSDVRMDIFRRLVQQDRYDHHRGPFTRIEPVSPDGT
jgi:hypothetical protein